MSTATPSCSSTSSLVLHWLPTEATQLFSPQAVSMILLLPLSGKSGRGRQQGPRGSTDVPLCAYHSLLSLYEPFVLFYSGCVAEVQLSDKAHALHVQSSRLNTPTQTHMYMHKHTQSLTYLGPKTSSNGVCKL